MENYNKNVFKFKIILNNNKKRESFCDKHSLSYQWTEMRGKLQFCNTVTNNCLLGRWYFLGKTTKEIQMILSWL